MRRLWIICLGLWLGLALQATAQSNVTSYAHMTAQIQTDAAHCSLLRLTSVGQSAKGYRALWLVRLADPANDPRRTIRILLLCRQHGDEPASTEAVLGLIHRLAVGGDPMLRAALAHVTLYIVPMVNPDGAEANTRDNGVGADLNRDWGIFHQPETRAVARAARLLHPQIVIDAHNWDGDDEYNADCLEIPRETVTAQGLASHALQQQAVRDFAACGYAVHPTAWGADSDPRLAHRWFARQNILSVLVETHSGSPADRTDFQRREGMYTALIHSLARHYAVLSATEKTRLGAWEGTDAGSVQEAALFPAVPPTVSSHVIGILHRRSYGWLWAFGIYGLALWGGRTHPGSQVRHPSRNGRGKRLERNAGLLSSPKL
ncbi:MAG: hypothetical protein M3Y13_08275, partial [Armatimonadota bacterium]|nr:hypothetical protein [Armatimonadota bacterium]